MWAFQAQTLLVPMVPGSLIDITDITVASSPFGSETLSSACLNAGSPPPMEQWHHPIDFAQLPGPEEAWDSGTGGLCDKM